MGSTFGFLIFLALSGSVLLKSVRIVREGDQVLVERLGLSTKGRLYQSSDEVWRVSLMAGLQVPLMARLWGADIGLVLDVQPTRWLLFNVSGGVSAQVGYRTS